MAKDERAPTAASSLANIPNKEKVPTEIHNQLSKEFVPAVKDVALTGAELLRSYQALQRSSDAYVVSLGSLARTAKSGTVKTQAYGKELNELVTEYAKILEFHKTCIKELTGIVAKTTVYGNEEKDKLKDLIGKYQKDDKDLKKQITKGTKKASDKEAFDDKSAKDFMRQQELRYRFFLDKHRKWFARYAELVDHVSINKKEVEAVKENGSAPPVAENKEGPPPAVPTAVTGELHIETDVVVEDHPHGDGHLTSNGGTSARTSISSMSKIPSRRPTNEIVPGVVLLSENRRISELPKMDEVRPVPVRETTERGSSPVPIPAPREERSYQPVQSYAPPPQVAPVQYQEAPRKRMEYTGPIIMPAPMPRAREPEMIQKHDPVMVPRTVDTPVYGRPERAERPQYIPERPHYHVESQYNPAVGPAHRPSSVLMPAKSPEGVVVPTMFNASDYGRVLTVTQDFNATSGEQMTVNRGDKVILIKSGSRGWIFIQDQATQRTGWIPAPFVGY